MPKYAIKDPISGQSVRIQAARAPTQAEAMAFLSKRQANIRAQEEVQAPGFAEAQAANEAARQQNIEQIFQGVPLYGATDAAKAAYNASTDLFGNNLGGQAVGAVAGLGGALGTAFNPITKAASNIPSIVQSIAEALGGQGGQAMQSITGERPVIPLKEFGDSTTGNVNIDTAGNLLSSALNLIQKDPINAALALEGGRRPVETFRGAVNLANRGVEAAKTVPSTVSGAIEAMTPNIVKRGVEVIAKVPDSFKKNVGRTAQDVFKPAGDTAKAELIRDIDSGALHDDLRNISEFGKPTNMESMLENGLIASDNLITLHNDFVTQFPSETISTVDIAQSIRADASKGKFKKKAIRDELNEFAERIDGEDTLQGSFETLQELNDMRRAYYEKSQKGQLTDLDNALHQAEQAARDQLSAKLDNFYRLKTGATDNPYRQYGSLKGRIDDLSVRLNNLLTDRGIEVSKGPSLDREVLATVKKNISLLKGGEKGRIDNRVKRMFELLEKEQTTNLRDLSPEEVNTLRLEKEKADRQAVSATTKDLNDYLKQEAELIKNTENQALADAIKQEVERAVSASGIFDKRLKDHAEDLGFFK